MLSFKIIIMIEGNSQGSVFLHAGAKKIFVSYFLSSYTMYVLMYTSIIIICFVKITLNDC